MLIIHGLHHADHFMGSTLVIIHGPTHESSALDLKLIFLRLCRWDGDHHYLNKKVPILELSTIDLLRSLNFLLKCDIVNDAFPWFVV